MTAGFSKCDRNEHLPHMKPQRGPYDIPFGFAVKMEAVYVSETLVSVSDYRLLYNCSHCPRMYRPCDVTLQENAADGVIEALA
jgi:hypothetical protein